MPRRSPTSSSTGSSASWKSSAPRCEQARTGQPRCCAGTSRRPTERSGRWASRRSGTGWCRWLRSWCWSRSSRRTFVRPPTASGPGAARRRRWRPSASRVLKLLRQWLQAGVVEDGLERAMLSGTPQGGVISPLLSNIYLHVLDVAWERQGQKLGTLVRYADDFVVMCDTKSACEQAEARVRAILARLG